jgi:hypothetical protein
MESALLVSKFVDVHPFVDGYMSVLRVEFLLPSGLCGRRMESKKLKGIDPRSQERIDRVVRTISTTSFLLSLPGTFPSLLYLEVNFLQQLLISRDG